MNKQLLLLLLVLSFGIAPLQAQNVVTGKITDDLGQSLPGVNVQITGTQRGTVSDSNGAYSIDVPDGASLSFSFIGFLDQRQEVAGRSIVNVTLEADVRQLSEVVVTALGVERQIKALQSSVTQVDGENFTMARENSLVNQLAGRVAGVNVSNISSGPAGSSRVVIRGAKTLGSNLNQPLYVVDGVPMTNNNNGQAGLWGGTDRGDGMTSINPDDIESTTVLKGASAAALYGSRAANGVILITTKKGTNRKGIGVEFNSNYVFETINDQRDFQTSHGSGAVVGPTLEERVATKATDPNNPSDLTNAFSGWGRQAWGPRFDGSQVLHWDGVVREYSYQGDQWDKFFETGYTWTNSLAFSGGNEKQNFRLSLADLRNESVVPNSGFDRFNASLSTQSKFGDKLSLSANILYSHEDAQNRPRLSDSPGNGILGMYYIPGDMDILTYIGDPSKPGAVPSEEQQAAQGITIVDGKSPGEEFQQSTNLWGQNPYWAVHQFVDSDIRDRVIGNGRLRYDITDFLYVQGRAGIDWSTQRRTNLTPQGTGYQRGGSMNEEETRVRETNLEWIVGYDETFGKLGVNAFVGGNRMRASWERIGANGNGFNVPFFAAINNAEQRNFSFGFNENGINSIFASGEVSWNGFLYVTGTWRRDWFSQLNVNNNSIDYPSVGLSFVVSDAVDVLPDFISFAKVRAAWGEVGNANSVGAYQTRLTYSLKNPHLGRPVASFSSAGGNRGNLPNANLVPFTSRELEFGFDVRFFNNRLGLDFAYYDQKTTDDILNAGISEASGFGTTSVNLGEISNKGIEILLSGTPIEGEVTWNVSLNFAKNDNEVVSLIEGQDELFVEEPRTRSAAVFHVVGSPYGTIRGRVQKTSPDGRLVFDENGTPITTNDFEIIGNGVADFTGGINNDLSWKNFNLGFLIDFKSGGDIYSGTNVRMTQAGYHKQTLQGREGEAPLTVTGVIETSPDVFEPFTKTLTPGEAQNYWNQLGNRAQENFIYDASFVKLRQVVFGYQLPQKWLANTPLRSVSLSFVGRNLAIIHSNVDNIDPESTYSSNNAQGLDYFGMPATRSYGFNLRAKF
ncbi:SusC/RagA family TonB-linked outer membrane protein [Fulvivirgaceae bacterium BMA12]|uniref:SusC/RagA family TonB-linked outer membrane protein n=1 Tax=Agaribacillus aureus TaxID=3051825 RepID=A0ABT8L6Q1_9BACT|nr:SusC/RagA family TonB-linked outer membrane protein [Fulvivirgaceae bacterium BMA12]